VAHEAHGGVLLRLVERDRLSADAHAVQQRHEAVAVLAQHPRVDLARADAELVADRGPQPQAVVGGVADQPPAVEAVATPEPGAQRVDRVGDHHDHAGPAVRQRRDDRADDGRVVAQVDHPRRVERERDGGADDRDVGVRDRAELDDLDRAGRARDDLLEVHLVRARHP
jgi:hypothetical protein